MSTEGTNSSAGTSDATAVPSTSVDQPSDNLEDLLRRLNNQIQGSDWLRQNTAEKWLSENPQAAQSLQQLFPDKILVPPNTPINTPDVSMVEHVSGIEIKKP